jgi:uncharacterized pyridoxamine 5'-phosphate oxidase family protein
MRFYSNENFDLQVVECLRELGHDVLTAAEAGNANQRVSDDKVLHFATQEKRVLLTFNRKDFFKLHKLVNQHAGIVACTYDANYSALANRINASCKDTLLDNQLVRIYRPS